MRRALLIALAVAGCVDDASTDGDVGTASTETSTSESTSTETSSSGSTSGTSTEPCPLFAPEDCGPPPLHECGCSASPIDCDSTTVSVSGWACSSPPEYQLAGDWSCLLEHLAQDTIGSAQIDVTFDNGIDECADSYSERLVLLGDGTALVAWTKVEPDLPTDESDDWRRVIVRPSEYFETCLAGGTPDAVAECLQHWYTEETCELIACCPISLGDPGPPACG